MIPGFELQASLSPIPIGLQVMNFMAVMAASTRTTPLIYYLILIALKNGVILPIRKKYIYILQME